jgi:hypothetical protein
VTIPLRRRDAGAYPISSFTWLLVYRNQTDASPSMARQLIRQLGSVSFAAR